MCKCVCVCVCVGKGFWCGDREICYQGAAPSILNGGGGRRHHRRRRRHGSRSSKRRGRRDVLCVTPRRPDLLPFRHGDPASRRYRLPKKKQQQKKKKNNNRVIENRFEILGIGFFFNRSRMLRSSFTDDSSSVSC